MYSGLVPGRENRAVEKIGELLPGRYVEIVLQPLDKQVSEALIGNILHIKGLPYSLCTQIGERAGGNLFSSKKWPAP